MHSKRVIMVIPRLYSAKQIEQQFHTGEEPVMVMCSDVNIYVCKYMRSSASAYKLACEFIGVNLAKAWQLNTPGIALVNIRPAHWEGINVSHSISAPSIGFRWLDGVVDITPSTYAKVPAKAETLNQLMKNLRNYPSFFFVFFQFSFLVFSFPSYFFSFFFPFLSLAF